VHVYQRSVSVGQSMKCMAIALSYSPVYGNNSVAVLIQLRHAQSSAAAGQFSYFDFFRRTWSVNVPLSWQSGMRE
jgi:hypothetical protein